MHLYIHIPFCSGFCSYCGFYSVKQLSLREEYLEALCKEIAFRAKSPKEFIKKGSTIKTIYIGGGTPSVLSIPQLDKILRVLQKYYNLSNIEEFTIEVNPDDITTPYALNLKSLGINRVSMGVQSLHDSSLIWMNRRHNAAQAIKAYNTLLEAGFRNISLDLIFGYAPLTDDMWREDIEKILELAPQHISAYQMSLEAGSKIYALARKGERVLHSQTKSAAQYSILQELMQQNGYSQYEISNFAKIEGADPSFNIAKHNSSYWSGEPYIGFGPGAHSYSGILSSQDGKYGIRSWNLPILKRYCAHYCHNNTLPVTGSEHLTITDLFNEAIMLQLRCSKGASTDYLKRLDNSLFKKIEPTIEGLARKGALILERGQIKIPPEKFFISDGIIRDLFIIELHNN